MITDWFSEVTVRGKELVKGVVVPHAGWVYSGRIAAESFAQMQGQTVDRVIVLGPCHRYYTEKCMLTKAHTVETPLGELEVDLDAVNKLNETRLFGSCSMRDEENEHSLEIELPFVYHLFGTNAKVVLIMVGNVSTSEKKKVAKALAPYLLDPKTAFVISSDFCHWGENFDYMYCKDRSLPFWQNIEELDKQGAALIEKEDADAFAEYIEDTGNTICGHNCIEIYLRALKESGLKTETTMLRYGQSNKATHLTDTSVSYCALRTIVKECLV